MYKTTVFFTLISQIACGQKQTFEQMLADLYKYTVPQIKSEQLQAQLADPNRKIYLLDSREPAEYQVSHLPNAVCIGYDKLNYQTLAAIPKDAELVIYCSVGYRSERIGEKLQKLGYTKVKNLYGGIFDWANKGNPLLNQQQQPTKTVHGYNKSWSKWVKSPNVAVW